MGLPNYSERATRANHTAPARITGKALLDEAVKDAGARDDGDNKPQRQEKEHEADDGSETTGAIGLALAGAVGPGELALTARQPPHPIAAAARLRLCGVEAQLLAERR